MPPREMLTDELTLEQLQREAETLRILPLGKAGLAIVQPTAVPEIGALISLDRRKKIDSLTWVRFRSGEDDSSHWSVPFSMACLCGKCSIGSLVEWDQAGQGPVSLIEVLTTLEEIANKQNLKAIVVDSPPRDVLSRIEFLKGINISYPGTFLEEFAQQRGVSTEVIYGQLGFVTGTIGRPFKQTELPLSCAA